MEYTLIKSQENLTLPQQEIIAVLEKYNLNYKILEENPTLVRIDITTDESTIKKIGKQLSYTHEILQTIKITTPEKLEETYKNIDWKEHICGSFKVRVKKMNQGSVNTHQIEYGIGGFIKKETKAKVQLENPETTIKIVYNNPIQKQEGDNLVTKEYEDVIITRCVVQQNKKHFFTNKPHKRPYFHPGSMSPKLALCMVNLAHVKENSIVWDPFCGTGGIIIEAGLLKAEIIGSDIDYRMTNGSKKNIEHEHIKNYEIIHGDARSIKLGKKVDAIVMDPPYGISTTTGGETTKKLYTESLNALTNTLKPEGYICMASPHYLDLKEVVNDTKLEIVQQHSIRMHRSLTRIITVLKHQK
ncbi:MAG: TIGR01177 family methyltransferase [Methanobacteriaceae archaeon]|nr:TIGR01177 family methyltransferase [Methanobacteriaceae archaeon]